MPVDCGLLVVIGLISGGLPILKGVRPLKVVFWPWLGFLLALASCLGGAASV